MLSIFNDRGINEYFRHSEVTYVNGKQHGVARWWFENGSHLNHDYYIKGNYVTKKEWEKYDE
jgi:antitoxin component YwqK of YwqJK toxin-antitoxin module